MTNFTQPNRALPFAFAIALLFSSAAFAVDEVNADKTGLAIGGYDPVSYFVGKPAKGSYKITATHQGATYRFATEANRKRFQKNPTHYAPQYGGYCAFGVGLGKKFSADPTVWKVVDGKLYLNLDTDIARLFDKGLDENIAKADKHWKNISDKAAK